MPSITGPCIKQDNCVGTASTEKWFFLGNKQSEETEVNTSKFLLAAS